jgi:hypothetical protein
MKRNCGEEIRGARNLEWRCKLMQGGVVYEEPYVKIQAW